MSSVRELHLVARLLYSSILALLFSLISNFDIVTSIVAVTVPVFLSSFMFQYHVVHFALHNLSTDQRGRLKFLLVWFAFALAGILFASLHIPSLETITQFTDKDEYLWRVVGWSTLFTVCGSMLVAGTCARRAFTRYNKI